MNRDAYKTVTGFVLLVPSSKAEASGEANFLFDRTQHVRIVSLSEIKKTASGLRGVDALHFDACLSLRGAMTGDPLGLDRFVDRFGKVMRAREEEMDRRLREQLVEEGWTIQPDGSATKRGPRGILINQQVSKHEPKEPLPEDARSISEWLVQLFSREVSEGIFSERDTFVGNRKKPNGEPPRIVCWYFKDQFRPAIYCPDLKSALYIHTFLLAPTGEVGFRTCPYDGEQFFQDRPNQEYCTPAHREAHRVARFRENKKRKAAERAGKGKKDGTQKAR